MTPKQIVEPWIAAFNNADITALAELYHENAINHQLAIEPIEGQESIRRMFTDEFSKAHMVCLVENIFEDASGQFWNGRIQKDCEVAVFSYNK